VSSQRDLLNHSAAALEPLDIKMNVGMSAVMPKSIYSTLGAQSRLPWHQRSVLSYEYVLNIRRGW